MAARDGGGCWLNLRQDVRRRNPRLLTIGDETYRHEFASLRDAAQIGNLTLCHPIFAILRCISSRRASRIGRSRSGDLGLGRVSCNFVSGRRSYPVSL